MGHAYIEQTARRMTQGGHTHWQLKEISSDGLRLDRQGSRVLQAAFSVCQLRQSKQHHGQGAGTGLFPHSKRGILKSILTFHWAVPNQGDQPQSSHRSGMYGTFSHLTTKIEQLRPKTVSAIGITPAQPGAGQRLCSGGPHGITLWQLTQGLLQSTARLYNLTQSGTRQSDTGLGPGYRLLI
jgi:hypothetical protein